MANFQSLPVIQPQPSDPFYPAAKLDLFIGFTRSSYLAATGSDAPTGDPSKRGKAWKDDSLANRPSTDMVTYNYLGTDATGKPAVLSFSVTVAEAMAVNIAGVHSYPAYIIDPTNAYTAGPDNSGNVVRLSGLNPGYLSTMAQAQDLAKQWGIDPSSISDTNFAGPIAIVYPSDELRRNYSIMYKGVPCNVGQSVEEMNHNGVGTPGKWDLTGPEPNWISNMPTTAAFVLPAWPDPVRALLPNEALASTGIFGGGNVMVYRTDMDSPYKTVNAVAVASTGGGMTDSQAAEIHHIRLVVDQINNAAQLPPVA